MLDALETWTERIPLKRPYTIAYETVSDVELGFVRVRRSAHSGLGCASTLPGVTGESEQDCRTALDALGALDPGDDTERERWVASHECAPSARAALDMALHDLTARERGLPLAALLGAKHGALETSVTIGIQPTRDELLALADEHVAAGFRCLKIKTGLELEEDLARVTLLRERFGSRIRLRIDANGGYAPRELERLFTRALELQVELVEQPLARADDAAYARLSEEHRRVLTLDESVVDVADARAHAALEKRCGLFNVKLMKCGGVTPALEIARIADAAGIGLLWGCSDESVIGIAAALHAACASSATRFLDLDGHLDLARDPARGGFVLEDGVMRLTNAPGLGVALVDDRGPR